MKQVSAATDVLEAAYNSPARPRLSKEDVLRSASSSPCFRELADDAKGDVETDYADEQHESRLRLLLGFISLSAIAAGFAVVHKARK